MMEIIWEIACWADRTGAKLKRKLGMKLEEILGTIVTSRTDSTVNETGDEAGSNIFEN